MQFRPWQAWASAIQVGRGWFYFLVFLVLHTNKKRMYNIKLWCVTAFTTNHDYRNPLDTW